MSSKLKSSTAQLVDRTAVPGSSSATPTPRFSCAICNSKEAKACAGCKSNAYCGKACQKADWPCHKLLCSALANCDYEKERPEGSIRAIVFPTEGAKPLLTYIPYGKDQKDGLHERAEEIINKHDNQDFVKMIAEALTDDEDYIKPTPLACIDDNKVRGGRDTENVLEVWTQLYYPGALPNKSISTAVGGKSKMFHPWDRAVLVFALSSPKTDPRGGMFYKDISLRDFRDAVDWIADFRNPARNRGEGPRENVRRETNWYKYNNPAAIAEDRAERRRVAQDRDSNYNDLFGGVREEPWEYEGYDDRYDDRFGGVEEEEMTDRGWENYLRDYMSL